MGRFQSWAKRQLEQWYLHRPLQLRKEAETPAADRTLLCCGWSLCFCHAAMLAHTGLQMNLIKLMISALVHKVHALKRGIRGHWYTQVAWYIQPMGMLWLLGLISSQLGKTAIDDRDVAPHLCFASRRPLPCIKLPVATLLCTL